MTDYTKKEIQKKLTKQQEEFFKERKFHLHNEKERSLSRKLESDATVQKYSELIKTFRPRVQAKQPSTFAFYGSAKQYYADAAYNILNYYPFDGTQEEVIQWYLDSPQVDVALLQQFWPSTVGHVQFGYSEYIDFYAGPQSISEAEFLGKVKDSESALQFGSDKGNTVEFWLKKEQFNQSTDSEVIFHIGTAPGYVSASSECDFKIHLSNSSGNPFHLTYKSASVGVENLQLNSDSLTTSSVADSSWHHYAFRIDHTGNNLSVKMYVDGDLESTTTSSLGGSIDLVNVFLKGRIGHDLRDSSTTGSLSGSLDEFRFWKGKRTEEQISKFYDKKVYSSDLSNNDYTSRLGLKYSFNRSSTGIDTKDSLVIDFSGNDVTGRIKNYSSSCRASISAIDLSDTSKNSEPRDPILDEFDTAVTNLVEELDRIGSDHDKRSQKTLKNYLPQWAQPDSEADPETKEFELLLHLLAIEFDSIKMAADSIRKVATPDYLESFQISQPDLSVSADIKIYNRFSQENIFLSDEDNRVDYDLISSNEIDFSGRLLEDLGINSPEHMLLYLASPEEEIESIVADMSLERSIYETRNMLYKCLANTYTYVANRKGTAGSYRSILNTLAMGEEVISPNIIGTGAELKVSDEKADLATLELKSISFVDNNEETLFMSASSGVEKSYLPASTSDSEYTFEGTFIFQAKDSLSHDVLESSIFGLHEVAATNNDLTVLSPDNCSFQVYIKKEKRTSNSAKFILKSDAGIIQDVESPIIYDVYNSSPWNISLRLIRQDDNNFLSASSGSNYKMVLTGKNYIGTELAESFEIDRDLTRSEAQAFQQANKTCYVGAHRTNITGSVIEKTDIKVVDFNAYSVALSDRELSLRSKNPGLEGTSEIYNSRKMSSAPESFKTLLFRITPSYTSELDSDNKINLLDLKPVPSDSIQKYGTLHGSKFNFKSTAFAQESSNVLQAEFLTALENVPIQNVHGNDAIQVKNNDLNKFDIDSRPILKILSFEKSMYRSISKEMIKFIGGVYSYHNLIGEPVNKYRKNYKLLDHFKSMFFEGVNNESQFERYVEYYRWIDKAIGEFLYQMVPASMPSNTGIENVVESHALERNKYDHKQLRIETKDLFLSTNLMGINEMLYDWEHGHYSAEEDEHCLWQKERADRTKEITVDTSVDSNRESIRKVLTTAVTGSIHGDHFRGYVKRNLLKPYKLDSDRQLDLKLGSNRLANKLDIFTSLMNEGKEITLNSDDIYEFRECDDVLEPSKKLKYTAKIDVTQTSGYLDGDADLILPFSMFSSSAGVDFENFKQDLVITNNHDDVPSMRSSWINENVGGMPHRRVKFNSLDSDASGFQKDRPEAYEISSSAEQLVVKPSPNRKSMFHRDLGGSRFYNIANIKTEISGSRLVKQGNYTKDYEIIQTSGRNLNNTHLVEKEGSDLTLTHHASEYVRGMPSYKVPERIRREHVFVNKFSALGAPEERGAYGRDNISDEFSVFSTVNYRNRLVRDVYDYLSLEHAEQFGYRPVTSSVTGKVFIGSMHKTNRNPLRTTGSTGNEVSYDNFYVQHHLPQNDFGYSWITSSADESVYSFISKNANIGHQHMFNNSGSLKSSQTISFVTGSELQSNLDFVGLNTYTTRSLDPDTNQLTVTADSLNTIILNSQGPYGWPTWKQTRGAEHPIARAHRKDNTFSIVYRGSAPFVSSYSGESFTVGQDQTPVAQLARPRVVENKKEIMVSNRFRPLNYSIHLTDQDSSTAPGALSELSLVTEKNTQALHYKSWYYDSFFDSIGISPDGLRAQVTDLPTFSNSFTIQNDLSKLANDSLQRRARIKQASLKDHNNLLKLNVLINRVENERGIPSVLKEANYIEKVYPREINTYTEEARYRSRFDFFGWDSIRSNRSLILTGNLSYDNFLSTQIGSNYFKYYPEITATNEEVSYEKSFFNQVEFVDLSSYSTAGTATLLSQMTHITSSKWVLDARSDYSGLPVNITASFMNDGQSWMASRDQGTRGEGILQNDYNTYALGINVLYGAPPISPVYNRRVPQTYGSDVYLAGEARWDAGENHKIGPFYDSYDKFSEETKIIGQEYTLVPEFCISRYSEDLLRRLQEDGVDVQEEISNIDDFLQVTGATYNTSSADFQIGSRFFKTYSTSDFLKHFAEFKSNVAENGFDLAPVRINLRCKAAKRFLPYRGFYPAERAVQISEIFARSYLHEDFYTSEIMDGWNSLYISQDQLFSTLKKKVHNSRAQAMKPLFGPGVLFNSIKSGIAVDYPIFSSSIGTFKDEIITHYSQNDGAPIQDFSIFTTSSATCVTGSIINSSTDNGIPRLKGNVSRRVSFEDLLDPTRLYGEKLHDNEPHPSASMFFGSSDRFSRVEFPFTFGTLDEQETKRRNAISFSSTEGNFRSSMRPYTSAIENFTAETVNFFLEDGRLQTIMSEPVRPLFTSNKTYKMRVYLFNNGIKMYDRHSAFGPPVDDGNPSMATYLAQSSSTAATAATGSVDVSSFSLLSDLDGETFTLEDTSGTSKVYRFIEDDSTSAVAATATIKPSSVILDQVILTIEDAESPSTTKTYKFEASAATAGSNGYADFSVNDPSSAKAMGIDNAFSGVGNYPFLKVTDKTGTIHTLRFYDSNSIYMTGTTSDSTISYINMYDSSASRYRTRSELISEIEVALEAALDVSVSEPSTGTMRITLGSSGTFATAALVDGNCFSDTQTSPCTNGKHIVTDTTLPQFGNNSAFVPASTVVYNGNVTININGMSTIGPILNEIYTVITHTNGHNGTITATVNSLIGRVDLTQATAGTAGNNTVTKSGSNSSNITVNGFSGGVAATTTQYSVGEILSSFSNQIAIPTTSETQASLTQNIIDAVTHANGHNNTISAVGSSGVVNFTQATAGTAGNNLISASSGLTSYVQGFAGAQSASSGPVELEPTSAIKSGSHGYLPYVPPFLDASTAPYAEITFDPPTDGNYSVPEIIEYSTVQYYNGIQISNSVGNTNYLNAMQLSASLDLFTHATLLSDNVQYERTSQPDANGNLFRQVRDPRLDSPRWIIQTKWETPVLDFSSVAASTLDLSNGAVVSVTGSPWQTRFQDNYYENRALPTSSYMTSSTGMWHQLGEKPSYGKGYYLTVTGPTKDQEEAGTLNLASKLGFLKPTKDKSGKASLLNEDSIKKLGTIATQKEISEAIVAIPFYHQIDKEGSDIEFFEFNDDAFDEARRLNKFARDRLLQVINMNPDLRSRFEKGYREFYDNPASPDGKVNIAYQLRMMDKFILPPHFDFMKNSTIKPHVQFFFQFKAKISQEQLQELWQNLYPDTDYGIFKAQHSSIVPTEEQKEKFLETSDVEFLSSYLDIGPIEGLRPGAKSPFKNPYKLMEKGVRWLIFKVKYRAESDYENLKASSISHAGDLLELNGIRIRNDKKIETASSLFNFNWPYDYFSIIESAQMEAKVDMYSALPLQTTPVSRADTPTLVAPNQASALSRPEFKLFEQQLTTYVSAFTDGQDTTTSSGTEVQRYSVVEGSGTSNSSGSQTDHEVNVTVSVVSADMVTRQEVKSNEDPAPSPANVLSFNTPTGSTMKLGSEQIYVNGVLQVAGASNDYTISGTTITFTFDIADDDSVYVTYLKEPSS